jgi:hypothetical protein
MSFKMPMHDSRGSRERSEQFLRQQLTLPISKDGCLVYAASIASSWTLSQHFGRMNVMWYTGKFDETTWTLFAFIGGAPYTPELSMRV